MIIVLIDWYIKTDRVDAFFEYWKKTLEIKDEHRKNLIGEFLSDPSEVKEDWITWDMQADVRQDSTEHDPCKCKRFVNVGLWKDIESFSAAIKPRDDKKEKLEEFEYVRRRRAVLTPKEWRRKGCWGILKDDSEGVL